MPKSNLLPPSIAPPKPLPRRSPPASDLTPAALQPHQPAPQRSFANRFAAAIRWLHIYVSLIGFTALMFFAVTGITLNHPAWFGTAERTTTHQGEMPINWLRQPPPRSAASAADDEESADDQTVSRLEVVEHLRTAHRIRGAVGEFRIDEVECLIVFKGPGYAADAYVNRDTGKYELTETSLGAVAVINDLHKGRDTGFAWSIVIDITALLMVFVSITGIVLLFYLKRKRWSGLVTAAVGTIALALAYWLWVP